MDSPFLYAPPDLPPADMAYGQAINGESAGLSRGGFAGLSSSLTSLTMPLWPNIEAEGRHEAYGGRSTEGYPGWEAGSIRPFTAPASAYYYSSYAHEEPVFAEHAGPMQSYAHSSALYSAMHKPNPMPSYPLSAGPAYIRPMAFASRLSRPEQEEPVQGNSNGSPFLYAPPTIGNQPSYGPSPAFLHQRPATSSAALYGGLSAVSSSSADRSRPSTGSRPRTATSSTSTLEDDEEEEEEIAVVGTRPPKAAKAKKRPRRKFEEIERIYKCSFPGCTKGYGTLNHLNAHVTMQKHGPKRLPQEFKAVRKEWRERQKAKQAKKQKAGESPEDGAERDDEDLEQTPTPPNVSTPKFDTPGSVGRRSSASSVGYASSPSHSPVHVTTAQSNTTFVAPTITSPAPMAYPQPLRPQTAPSVETLSFMMQHSSPERVSPSQAAYHQPRYPRRTSLPNAQYLPTLHEAPGEHYQDQMGVYS